MKYLLVTALILGIVWLWRRNRQAEKDASARASANRNHPQNLTEMVACRVCQVHLPRSEALIGRGSALYCSEAHRREAEG